MNKYIILTDSTTDLTNEFVVKNDIKVLPLTFTLMGNDYKNYLDERELTTKDFYQAMREGNQPITSQVNSEEFIEFVEPLLEKKNDILYVCFSSALSGTFNSARLATEELIEKYPDSNIKVVDSKLASMGEGLLVYYANKFKEQGLSLEENITKLEEIKTKICAWFTVSDIETLRRGGRVSNAAAFVAKTLKIKPILHMDIDGKLVARTKKIGRKHSLTALIEEMEKRIIVENNEIVFISHGDCLEEANFVKAMIEERFGITNFLISNIGPVIGSHTGPDGMAIFFIGEEK